MNATLQQARRRILLTMTVAGVLLFTTSLAWACTSPANNTMTLRFSTPSAKGGDGVAEGDKVSLVVNGSNGTGVGTIPNPVTLVYSWDRGTLTNTSSPLTDRWDNVSWAPIRNADAENLGWPCGSCDVSPTHFDHPCSNSSGKANYGGQLSGGAVPGSHVDPVQMGPSIPPDGPEGAVAYFTDKRLVTGNTLAGEPYDTVLTSSLADDRGTVPDLGMSSGEAAMIWICAVDGDNFNGDSSNALPFVVLGA